MASLTEIKTALQSSLPGLRLKYPIETLAIFGSYARGEATQTSDLDLVVKFNGEIGWEFFDLAGELEDILHQKVDLVSERAIKPHYWLYIKQDMIYV